MATQATTTHQAAAPPASAEMSTPWLHFCLTLLLIALAVFQLVYLVPRCLFVVQHLAGHWVPAPLRLLASIPEWLGMVAGLSLAGFTTWHRRSLHRVALLATIALAVNVGLFLSLLSSLFQVLSR